MIHQKNDGTYVEKDIKDCYCIVQIDGKYKGSSNWNCVGYGYPEISDIPEKYKDEQKYKISKIGDSTTAKDGKGAKNGM